MAKILLKWVAGIEPKFLGAIKIMSEKTTNPSSMRVQNNEPAPQRVDVSYETKLRRRVEDRIRKDREALYLVARVLNID